MLLYGYHVAPLSCYEKWSGNQAKSKDFSIVFDYYVGGMSELAKNDCARLLWLKGVKRGKRYSNLVSHVPSTGGLCTCRQRKHDDKPTTIPFHGFPDLCF